MPPRTPIAPSPEPPPEPRTAERRSPLAWAQAREDLTRPDPRKPGARGLTPKGAACAAGVAHQLGYCEGREITEAEFTAALAAFLAAPVGR